MDANAVYLDNNGQANIPVDSSQMLLLRIEGPSGNIAVRGAARSDVLVTADGYDADDDDVFPLLAIEARGNIITIKPHGGPAGEPFDFGGDLETILRKAASWISRSAVRRHDWPDLTVEIPRELVCRLDAHAASGDIEIEEVSGALVVRSASGDLHLSRILGQLNVQSASGDVNIDGSVVALTARSASGDLHITETVLDGVHAQTASGDCYVEGSLRGGHQARVQTASGDVHFTLEQPESSGATVTFRTVAGSSNVDDPFRRVAPRRWQLGNGNGPQIEVTTVSGDLHVDASFSSRLLNGKGVARYAEMAPVPPAPPSPPTPPAAPASPASPATPEMPSAPRVSAAPPVFTSDDLLAFAPPAPNESDFLDSTADEDDPAPQRTPEEAARIALLEAVARGELDIEEALRRLDAGDA